jgi:transposase
MISDLLPEQHTRRLSHPWRDHRAVLNGIFWVLCSGASWRDVPERYGPWSTVYTRFRRWRSDGTFDRILRRLQIEPPGERGLIDYATWMADSTSVRASKAAAGARKKGIRANLTTMRWDDPGAVSRQRCTSFATVEGCRSPRGSLAGSATTPASLRC